MVHKATRKAPAKNPRSGAHLMAPALAAGTCAVVFIFSIFAVYYDVGQRNLRRQEIESYLTTVGRTTAWGVDTWLTERVTLAEDVAHMLSKPAGSDDYVTLLANPVYEKTFIWTYFGESNGAYHIWPPDDGMPVDYDPRTRPWYHAAFAAEASTLTEPYFDITTGVETITVASPVFRDGKMAGVVGADFSTQTLSNVLEQTDLGGLGFVFLVTGNGKIIAHPDRELVSTSIADVYPQGTPRIDNTIQYLKSENGSEIVNFVSIPSLSSIDWRLGVSIDRNKAYAGLHEFRTSAAIALVAAVLLMIAVLGVVIHRLLVRPLTNARAAADAASAAKSEFLANMSHEIRTPMNGVMGMAELLARTELTTKQKTFADIILKSGNALITIINDILDFSKIDSGQITLDPQPFDLKAVVEDVASLVATKIDEKNLELIVRFHPNMPEEYIGDDGRIRQILMNLVGNAVKFTEAGHILINVSGSRRGNDAELNIRVEDTGIGIPDDKLDAVFDKFNQIDNSATRKFEGTGLGLAICRMLIEKMDGSIGVESELGCGSTFWFKVRLPVHGAATIKRRLPNDITGSHVLIVDDNEINRAILTEQLESWGMTSLACASAREGLAALNGATNTQSPIDLIIMDFQMPEMDGIEATRRIRANEAHANIPIIMLTSVCNEGDTADYRRIGIQAHLIKPARSSLLFETIVEAISDAQLAKLKDVAHTAPSLNLDELCAEQISEETFESTGVKVLVAEDNEVNQCVISEILNSIGHHHRVAGDGREVIDLLPKYQPDIVLMDVSMPVMNGLEATAEIRRLDAENGGHTLIIGLTANALKGDREKCLNAGMDDYLSKPVDIGRLERCIAKWVGRDGLQSAKIAG